ncbi:MAG: hypothetical protein AABY15_07075 [Nanoarchaeota archaeon]
MDFIYVTDDGETYDDLDDFCQGCFMFGGEIYMDMNMSDDEIFAGLENIYKNHPDEDIKKIALNSCILKIMQEIKEKYC